MTPRLAACKHMLLRPLAQLALRTIPARTRTMATAATPDLSAQIAALGAQIKQLKTQGEPCDAQVKQLLELKTQAGLPTSSKKSKGSSLVLKTPKGTIDHKPTATLLRKRIFSTLESIFVMHGASTIDTPVFELKEILAGKYGEDSKLIYDLQDQGGELCSLRYDLTVPFARYLAMNGVTSMKRFHIAKVYRRDQPVMSKGRMREFYQCDFDIAGTYDAMVPDAEVLSVVCEALTALDIGEFTIKINHRKVLDGIFELAGVPADKTRAISSAVDKLDKAPWADVKKEMTVEKGLSEHIADKIGEYVGLKGPGFELLAKLQADEALMAIPSAKAGLADMEILFGYLEVYGVLDKMSFDMSLARGLDYYTGIIYEAIHESSAPPGIKTNPAVPASGATSSSKKSKSKKDDDEVDESSVGVGSIAAGGRYDELVGMFSEAAGGKKDRVPCVGVSVGVERVYSIMEARRKNAKETARSKETDVFVMALGDGLLKERMGFAKMLWDAGIKAEFMYKAKPKTPAQWKVADDDQIPYVAILAPKELAEGKCRIKAQVGKDEAGDSQGEEMKITDVVAWLKARIGTTA